MGAQLAMTNDDPIDLRSDTKTLPTEEMLDAMRRAELGDSKANEDPTVLRLEAMACERLGTEAAMLVISGTMANLCALMVHASPGDGLIIDPDAHVYFYEGGHTAIAGLQPLLVESEDGLIDPDALAATVRRYRGRAKLLCLENTHNRGGGRVVPIDRHDQLCAVAHENGLATHVDGARIFNAAVASGTPAAEYGHHVDSIMFCLSKSLSCPLGSVLCGSGDFIQKAKAARARLGGGMRQAGVIAAAGIVALETMIDRLAQDHALARCLAEAVNEIPGLSVKLETVETNMVNVDIASAGAASRAGGHDSGRSVHECIEAFGRHGVLAGAHWPDKLRLVVHRHHSAEVIDRAIGRMQAAVSEL